MKNDLNRIKKLYGEEFAKQFCRPNFSHLIEREDFSLADFLTSIVAPSKYFYEDLIVNNKLDEFRNSIWGMFSEDNSKDIDINETPEELMKKAGYTLYKCNSNRDMLKFQKYYSKGEELCTYDDHNRINTHTIFWAVKDNAKELKREDFTNPKRQDDYGTSVLSIQFTKGLESTVSIINRYNLSVKYGDSTFSNNLEKIQPGLTASFKKYYGINLVNGRKKFKLPGYIVDNNGIYHKVNHKIENIYYCDNNIVIVNGVAKQFRPEQYILADYYIFDRRNKTVELLSQSKIQDSFVEQFYNIKKIEAELFEKNKVVKVFCGRDEPIVIITNQYGQIISLVNNNVEYLGDGFMCYCQSIENLELGKVKTIGDDCLLDNRTLKNFQADHLQQIGDRAFCSNTEMEELSLNNTVRFGDLFFTSNKKMKKFSAKKAESFGRESLFNNTGIKFLTLPKLKSIKPGFMKKNDNIERFYAPLLSNEYKKYLNPRMEQVMVDNLITKIMEKISSTKDNLLGL